MACCNHLIGGVGGEEGVTGEEDKYHKWTELDCPAMVDALGVLT